MATLTNEQIEAKKQQLKQLAEEVMGLKNELMEAGTTELSEDDLDKANGGYGFAPFSEKEKEWLTKLGEDAKKFDELAERILQ